MSDWLSSETELAAQAREPGTCEPNIAGGRAAETGARSSKTPDVLTDLLPLVKAHGDGSLYARAYGEIVYLRMENERLRPADETPVAPCNASNYNGDPCRLPAGHGGAHSI